MKIKFGIRGKILAAFLALSLVSLGIVSSLAIRNMGEIGSLVKQNSISMGETIEHESISALEALGRKLIRQKTVDVAKDMELFIERHPDLDSSEQKENLELRGIAIQSVGRTGHTTLYDTSYTVYFHVDHKLVGKNLHEVAGEPIQFWSILERSILGEASGYYNWEDNDGNIRTKYMHTVPVEGTDLIVAAATYIDEFSAPAQETKDRIAAAVQDTSQYIDEQLDRAQLLFLALIVGMLAVVTGTVFLLARTITRPILSLTEGAEIIGKGKLDYSIQVNTGDEIELLARQFNKMASTLKESHTNLEQKIEERTRQERQRAEQLRTVNEVSRKISSIINLDELLPYVVNLLRQSFDYYNVNLFLYEPNSNNLVLKAGSGGYTGTVPIGTQVNMEEEGIVGWVAQTGAPLLINDVTQEPRYHIVEGLSETKSELAVAVKMGEKVLGVLDIESTELDAFSEADMFTAQTLADQLAVAIENARLYQETRQIAVMEERNRIAREIHDTLAQGFTGIIMQLEAADQVLGGDDLETKHHLDQAQSLARKSLNEARRSVWNLRPQPLENLTLVEALKQEVEKFTKDSYINTNLKVSGNITTLPPAIETALFRICQESLNNVRRHARANHAEASLAFEESLVELSISDDGTGFESDALLKSTKRRRTFGLISMQERARGLGGTFTIQSEKGKGTLIRVIIPLKRGAV